jgi:catechol 2,3-dioxygenase-like lactoylglutathione lyase family enzyme
MATETKTIVTGTDFLCVPTSDLDAARRFYEEVLGLPLLKTWGSENPVGAEYETGNLTLALCDSERLGMEYRTNTHPVALRVDDVAAARAEPEARGVEFHGDIVDSGVCHMAYFRDVDGNALMLHHRYAPPEGRPAGAS